jgi:hypothetical protein
MPSLMGSRGTGGELKRWNDDAVTLSRAQFRVVVPLAYVEVVHPTAEPAVKWMLGLSCTLRAEPGPPPRIEVRKFNPRYDLSR